MRCEHTGDRRTHQQPIAFSATARARTAPGSVRGRANASAEIDTLQGTPIRTTVPLTRKSEPKGPADHQRPLSGQQKCPARQPLRRLFTVARAVRRPGITCRIGSESMQCSALLPV